ncbi:MAG: rod shape-determining protein RodA [Chitinophagaceae bacterium]|nr:MAG: rod shape-determining protein RodA [Chitinophagaceae bacterium]
MNSRSGLAYMDKSLIFILIILMIIGWLTIFAVEYQGNLDGLFSVGSSAGKQLRWIGISLAAGAVVLLFDTRFFTLLSYPLYILGLLLLVVTIFFGVEVSGSKSWLEIGGLRFQTPELAKLTTALALSRFLSVPENSLDSFKNELKAFLLIFTPLVIIIFQNETGTALVFLCFFLVLFRAGQSFIYILLGLIASILFVLSLMYGFEYVILVLAILAGISIWVYRKRKNIILLTIVVLFVSSGYSFGVHFFYENVLQHHQQQRVDVLLGIEQDLFGAGYNLNQSKIAIGSGGLTGKGFLQGTQTKFDFVPEQNTDFIFCTIGEEFGFLGSITLLSLFLLLLFRITHLAERQRSGYSAIYAYAIASIIFMHIVINIGMTIGLMPIIGIPLPFISYGGSSLLIFTVMIFIFIRLDADRLFVLR